MQFCNHVIIVFVYGILSIMGCISIVKIMLGTEMGVEHILEFL